MIKLTGSDLTIEQVIRVVRGGERVELSDSTVKNINRAREMVDKLVEEEEIVYGVTTGFGRFSNRRICIDKIIELQENLIKSHAAGCGNPLPREVVKAMMLLRSNALAGGYSGIRLETLQLLLAMINQGVIPWVPEHGSVGASGDLIPLSHMVLVMLGKGKAYVDGELITGEQALVEKGLKPVRLGSKEGLALINGTQMMGGYGVLAVHDSNNLVIHADLALALSLEAMQGILAAFDPDIHKLRPHPGQIQSAKNIRQLTAGSQLALREQEGHIQDAYSLRCGPQVHGASRDALTHVNQIISRELNSVTDNPLFFPEQNKVLSGGNFHGQPLALGLDYLAIAVSELGNISERRTARMLDANLNNGLDMFLTRKGGLNSGYMIAQYTAASLVAENKVLASPASIDSIPTSANKEDHVSMGSISARKAREIISHVEQILAIELITACQGIDLRSASSSAGTKLGAGSRVIYQKVRELVPRLDEDRILYPELKEVKELVHSGELVRVLQQVSAEIK